MKTENLTWEEAYNLLKCGLYKKAWFHGGAEVDWIIVAGEIKVISEGVIRYSKSDEPDRGPVQRFRPKKQWRVRN